MAVAITRAGATGRLLHDVLAAPFWRPLAELTYSAYLGGFGIDMAVSVPAAFAVAFLSHRLVEVPAVKLGRRLEPLLFGGLAADVNASCGDTAAKGSAGAAAQAA